MDTLHRCYTLDPAQFDNVVLVTHGIISRLFMMRWFHWTVETFQAIYNLRNAEYIIMERQRDGRSDAGFLRHSLLAVTDSLSLPPCVLRPPTSYKLTTPLRTSAPDAIKDCFVDGVSPEHTPPNPERTKIEIDQRRLREEVQHHLHCCHAAVMLLSCCCVPFSISALQKRCSGCCRRRAGTVDILRVGGPQRAARVGHGGASEPKQ